MRLCGVETNALQNNSYKLILPRFPHVEYFATDFVIPEVALPAAIVPTPLTNLPVAGDKPMFGPLKFDFLISEDMSNYIEAHQWLYNIGFAENHTDYTTYSNKDKHQPLGEQDAKVVIYSSKGNPIKTITFYDAIPISLSGIAFTSQDPNTNFVKASLTMAYSIFDFTN